MKKLFSFFLLLFFVLLVITACSKQQEQGQLTIKRNIDVASLGKSFIKTEDSLCTQEGKPIIREYATSWCPHCRWVKPVFQEVVNKYVKEGKIVAYQWEVDTGNDLLTERLEAKLPAEEMDLFKKYSPKGAIPTFVIGCKYYRTGNLYEEQNDKDAEAAELKAVIDQVLKEVKS